MKSGKQTRRIHIATTTEGWYYIGMLAFIVAGAMIRDINLLYIMAGMMLGPFFFSWYASIKSLRRIRVQRRLPKLVSVGDPLFIEVELSKPKSSPRAFATVVQDRILRDGDSSRLATTTELFFPIIRSGSAEVASYRATLQRRGRYDLGPMKVSTSMPLGLVRVTKSFDDETHVLVSPRIGSLSTAWSRHLEFKNDGGQKSARRRGNAEGDFYGMREWRNGDSLNRIHWRTSAKRNKLTVRQFEQRVNEDLVVILDLWEPEALAKRMATKTVPNSHQQAIERVEAAISFAATLIVEHCRQGATHVVFASASRSGFELHGLASPVFRQELMEKLAMVSACADDQLATMMADVLPLASANSKIVLVSTSARDLSSNKFDALTQATTSDGTAFRRGLSDIVQVNSGSQEFHEWFREAGKLQSANPPQTNGESTDGVRNDDVSAATRPSADTSVTPIEKLATATTTSESTSASTSASASTEQSK